MKVVKIILKILLAIIIIAGLVIAGFNLYHRFNSSEFYKSAEKEFIIPGLGDNFIPQGITYDENSGYYLISGYMSDGTASRIYTVDPNTNDYSYVSLKTENGKPDVSHAGGIAAYGRYVLVAADEGLVEIFRLNDVTNTDLSEVQAFSTFKVENASENIYVNGDTLYVGEFYIAKNYETPENHHYETDTGEKQQAIMLTYDVGEIIRSLSLDDAEEIQPICAYAITDQVQGVCILKGGQICLSTSWGLQVSHIKIYDDPAKTNLTSDNTFTLSNGKDIPVYYLDSDSLLVEYKLPPMAEELYVQGDKVLIMCESACNKYFFGKLTNARNCFSFIPEF